MRRFALITCLLFCVSHARAQLTIKDVRLIDYSVKRTKAFTTAKGSTTACTGIFVVVTADNGRGLTISALGDILPRGLVTNETMKDAAAGAAAMRKALVGQQFTGESLSKDVERVRTLLTQLDAVASAQKLTTSKPPPADKQLRATLCGFDEALLDLVSQAHGVPLYEALGGKKRDEVTVSALTYNADDSADALADGVETAADQHLAAIRVKIGLNDASDLQKLAEVARELKAKGADTKLWVDVNQAWKTADESLAMLSKIRDSLKAAGFTSTFICEQPTSEKDLPALAAVTKAVREWNKDLPFKLVIMADEAVWTLADTSKMVELDAADLLNIKIQKCGGLLAGMEIANYLQAASPNTGIYVGGVVSTDVTSWANLQLCHALPRLDYATSCIPRRMYVANVASVPVEYAKGRTMKMPTAAGLGTFLDLKKLEPHIRHDSSNPSIVD